MMETSLQRWRNKRFARWVASTAAVALLLVVSAFLAHQHDPGQIAKSTASCELCLQITTVGAAPAKVGTPDAPLNVQRLLPSDDVSAPTPRLARSYRSRAPPVA